MATAIGRTCYFMPKIACNEKKMERKKIIFGGGGGGGGIFTYVGHIVLFFSDLSDYSLQCGKAS